MINILHKYPYYIACNMIYNIFCNHSIFEFTSTVRTSISYAVGIVCLPEFFISQNLIMWIKVEEIELSGKSKAMRTPIPLPNKIAKFS